MFKNFGGSKELGYFHCANFKTMDILYVAILEICVSSLLKKGDGIVAVYDKSGKGCHYK